MKQKRLVKFFDKLSMLDVMRCVQGGWAISKHNGRICLENDKTVFLPVSMPYVKFN